MNAHSHNPRKRFGQNFLIDEMVIHELVQLINPLPQDVLVEIGPGLGAISKPLLAKVNKLIAIEIDRDLIQKLAQQFSAEIAKQQFILVNQDVLQVDFLQLFVAHQLEQKKIRILGNLPYNISSPLLFKLFPLMQTAFAQNFVVADWHFMLQKEVANRLCAKRGTRQYGRLSVMANYYCATESILDIDKNSFHPVPQVTSSMERFVPHKILPCVAHDENKLQQIVAAAFSQKRKVISNSLKKFCTGDVFEKLGIDPALRAEQLSVGDFVRISNFYT